MLDFLKKLLMPYKKGSENKFNMLSVNEHVNYQDGCIMYFESIQRSATIKQSKNGHFILALADSCITKNGTAIGGSRKSGDGTCLIFYLGKEIIQFAIPRPVDGVMADNGNCAILDLTFNSSAGMLLRIFDKKGKEYFQKRIRASLAEVAITADGDVVACNWMTSNYMSYIVLIDVASQKCLFQKKSKTNAARLDFDGPMLYFYDNSNNVIDSLQFKPTNNVAQSD